MELVMKDIYIYSTLKSWLSEKPDTTIKGTVVSKENGIVEIQDENQYTQLINLTAIFAIVY